MYKSKYGFGVDLKLDFDTAIEEVTARLKEQGFGILTEIDVKDTLKKKLDVDFRRYRILGACNPPLAHRALSAEEDIGLLLPCNVIIYETNEGVRVAAMDPVAVMSMVDNDEVKPVAKEVGEKLAGMLSAIEGAGGKE